jgi:hypothetical protein
MKQMTNWQKIKKWGKRMAIAFGVIYVLGVIDQSLPRPPQCPIEEHRFQGEKFDIELCLNLHDNSERIGIFVYSKEGALLAWRGATFPKESRLNYMAIEDTMIRYSNNSPDITSETSPEDCVLYIPPTWVDWLEVRLPGGIPGVSHCGVASDEVSAQARQSWRLRQEAKDKKREASLNNQAPDHAVSPAASH